MDETNLDAGTNASENEATAGTSAEELDTTDVETNEETSEVDTDDVEEEEEIDKEVLKRKKNIEKSKKLLSERNQARDEAKQLKLKLEIKELKEKHWEFDENAVLELVKLHPTLSLDDAVVLHSSKTTKKEEPKEDFGGIIGRESRDLEGSNITLAQLKSMPADQYAKTRDLIDAWKIKLISG